MTRKEPYEELGSPTVLRIHGLEVVHKENVLWTDMTHYRNTENRLDTGQMRMVLSVRDPLSIDSFYNIHIQGTTPPMTLLLRNPSKYVDGVTP